MEEMKTRSARLIVGYNGREISGNVEDFTYTDPAGGASDSISIKMDDRDGKWIDAWMPEKGDMITAAFLVEDWQREGDSRNLFAGEFATTRHTNSFDARSLKNFELNLLESICEVN